MKWLFYLVVFLYMFYRAVYGERSGSLNVPPVKYEGGKNFSVPGVRKSITCKGININHKLEWIDPHGTAVSKEAENRVYVKGYSISYNRKQPRIPTLELLFSSVMVGDSGVWQCRAGEEEQNVMLCVIDPSRFVDTPTEVSVDIGRSITLSCQARGDPEPTLRWFRNGVIITDNEDSSKYRIMKKYNSQGYEGLLTIMYLAPEDSGEYICEALQETPFLDDCSHTESLKIELHVNYAPIFKEEDAIAYGRENERVSLLCSASSYPIPTYRWFKIVGNDLWEYAQEQIQIDNEEAGAVITLLVNASSYDQSYKCRATNQYGEAEKIFTIKETTTPTSPSEVESFAVSSDKIHLKITWNERISFPVEVEEKLKIKIHFDVQISKLPRTKTNQQRSKTVALKPDQEYESDNSENDKTDFYVTVPNLDEATDYELRLRAVNSVGVSRWSPPILASTVLETEDTDEPKKTVDEKGEVNTTTVRPVAERADSDTSFYGIFFAGGIALLAALFMVIMRMV